MNKDMVTATTKPEEELKTPEQLEAQKHYLERRQDYARLEEDRRALGTLFAYNPEEMNEGLLEIKKANADQLHEELNTLEANPALPKKLIKTDTFDKEFFDRELNKVRESLGEPTPEPKAKYTKALRDEERERIKNNFPKGLFKRGTEVKYEGDQWTVAGYDGYTGRGILKRDVEGGEVEYIFAERVPLYLENRIKSKDLVKSGSVPSEVASESGLNPQACIEMVGDDNFDYERAQAEQEARQGDKLGKKFKDLFRKAYEKSKKELGSFFSDSRDAIKTEKEPFRATIKDLKETATQEYESTKATGQDILKDLKTGKEKVGHWFKGRQRALAEALANVELANSFRNTTKAMGKELENMAELLKVGNQDLIKKWIDSGYDPSLLDDETLYRVYSYFNEKSEEKGIDLPEDRSEGFSRLPEDMTLEDKKELFDIVFLPLKYRIEQNVAYQNEIVEATVNGLGPYFLLNHAPDASSEERGEKLQQLREELNKELTKVREGQVAVDKKRIIKIIRDALDKDYLSGYVYAPLKAFRSRPGKFSKSENPDNEIFEI